MVSCWLLAFVSLSIIFESSLFWDGMTLLIAVIAAYEWGNLSGLRRTDSILFAAGFFILAIIGDFLLVEASSARSSYWGTVALFWALIAPWWVLLGWVLPPFLLSGVGLLLLFAAWYAAKLLFASDFVLLMSGMIAVWIFDSIAFMVGRMFGKTPMAPKLSPKKTFEGFLGGATAVFVGCILYRFYLAEIGQPMTVILSVSFTLVVLATVGDLFESSLKRRAGVKDSGIVLGEHGGVLDRIDALLPVLPFIALLSLWLE